MASEQDLQIDELKGRIEDLQKRVTQCEQRLANIDKLLHEAQIT